MTDINLCSLPFLSIDYSNVIDFQNIGAREYYFTNKILRTIEGNIKYDNSREYININLSYEELRKYDYLYFKSLDNKPLYYFITDIEMKTKSNCNVYIKLDVFTTYMFDYTLLPSFVDRCHVQRWIGDIPTQNNEDEGLEKGEIIQDGVEKISDMNKTVVISSSVPIGYVEKPYGNGGTGGTGGSSGDWKNGVPSSLAFRISKGYEGYAPTSYADMNGYHTIGYGVTQIGFPNEYNSLKSKEPASEEDCARVSWDIKVNSFGKKIVSSVKNFGCTSQNQFDALLLLSYNLGVGRVTGDNVLTRAIANNPLDETTIRPIWENFIAPTEHHKKARKEQCDMFFGKDVTPLPISIWKNGTIIGTVTENNGDGWLPSTDVENGVGDIDGYKSFNNEYGNDWLCPVKGGTVTSKWGWRTHPTLGGTKFHNGCDIGIAQGKPTVASKSGTVSQTGFHASMGNYIYIDTGEYRTKYMHLSKINVEKGQSVTRGQKVGEIGSTGNSSGPHCHWELVRISDNESCNPCPTLKVGDKV